MLVIGIHWRKVEDLKDLFEETGFRLAHPGYMSITVGTAFGFSIALERNDQALSSAEGPAKDDLTTLQKVVMGVFHRSRKVAVELQDETLEVGLSCVSCDVIVAK